MSLRDTPPYSASNTPDSKGPDPGATSTLTPQSAISFPRSTSSEAQYVPDATTTAPTVYIPPNLTQDVVEADPQLKRLQQDLLILTGFNDNSTLHWRPDWFPQAPFSRRFWTLHNPPNVITEYLPHRLRGRYVFTRRMRRAGERSSSYIRDVTHWKRYCEMFGIPESFLCPEQIELMRLGLLRSIDGSICEPPSYPLYPEPQPLGLEHFLLDPSTYETHLPEKFHCVDPNFYGSEYGDHGEVVVVHSNGILEVQMRDEHFLHECQFRYYDGYGGRRPDENSDLDMSAPRDQGPGRRWSHIPWTKEQEESCQPLKLRLRLWNTAMQYKSEDYGKYDDGSDVEINEHDAEG